MGIAPRTLIVLAAALSLIGCRRKTVGAAPSHDAAPPVVAAAAPPPAPARDAGSRPLETRKRVPPNLLQAVPSKLAVSSTVDNPRDFPEHLVDGRAATAWNGKSGDVVGAWIAFRVPADAHVDHVEMTAGFDKKSGEMDLFSANHRIKRVKVHRGKALLHEITLDVNDRGLQKIPIGADGGVDFKIEIVETAPGTKPEWREIVVSEFLVVGAPGKARRKPDQPLRVAVGDLDADEQALLPVEDDSNENTYPSLAAYCAELIGHAKAAGEAPPACKVVAPKVAFTGDATYKSLRAVETKKPAHVASVTRLFLELNRGFVHLSTLEGLDEDQTYCPSMWQRGDVSRAYVQSGHFVVWLDGYIEGQIETVGLDHGTWARGAVWCRDVGARLHCWTHQPAFHGPIAVRTQPRGPLQPWEKFPWVVQVRFDISPSGKMIVH